MELCKKVFTNTFYYRLKSLYGYYDAKYESKVLEDILIQLRKGDILGENNFYSN